ncbi:MAG: alpha-1,4-glucan--maltose-1-phosphate maltosyltransferase, partial [Solirubrobacterales bacterium]|nr:alpha-1,4-glucan--maltose-1-phosphate maltosyltransferase [Solirubrobacterales bacterium]
HPIGVTNRKGRNNTLVAGPADPGSPWAIGGAEGGHTAVHPDLGTIDDFDRLVAAARDLDIEIALDFAIQCSADHPWLTEHPEWFNRRPDGTLKYAENPPKTYQDIYNVNFACEDWRGLWDALLDVVQHWVSHGVKVFRVDNPHTKPLPFWEWLIAEVRKRDPEVVFLAEAFTRAAMMRTLAKVGFSQSYTYFTWKSSRWELQEYVTELATSGMQDYYRPNFFANTPDILTEELQHGGPAKFASRLVLAATLSPTYGIYSGYESFEHVPVRPGSEEYLDSEKYESRQRALDGPLLALVARLNEIRRENTALRQFDNVLFLDTENDALIAYAKRTADNTVITIVTLDPHHAQEGVAVVPYDLGLPPAFAVTDLLSGERFDWRMGRNFVRLDPMRVAHLLKVG